MPVDLIIRFPTEAHLKSFREWMDNAGEQYFMEHDGIRDEETPITRFDYPRKEPKLIVATSGD